MKKVIYNGLIILCMVLVLGFSISASAEEPIKVFVDGYPVQSDVDPIIINGRTMLPARAVFELFGAEVSYDLDTRTVTAIRGEKEIKIIIDSNIMYVNGEAVELDVPATIVNSRTLVPVRACAVALSSHVEWFGESRTVKISSEAYRPALEMAEQGKILEGKLLLESLGNDPYAKSLLRRFIVKPKTVVQTSIDHEKGTESNYVYNYEYDDKGNVLKSPEFNGITYAYEYDEYGRVIKMHGDGYFDDGLPYYEDGSFAYSGERIVKSSWGSAGGGDSDIRYYYDSNGYLIRSEGWGGPYNTISVYVNDEHGNRIRTEEWYAGVDGNGQWYGKELEDVTTYSHEYDEYGNRVRTIEYNQDGYVENEYKYHYLNGKLVKCVSLISNSMYETCIELEYNEKGNCVKIVDARKYLDSTGEQDRYTYIYECEDNEIFYFPHIVQKNDSFYITVDDLIK